MRGCVVGDRTMDGSRVQGRALPRMGKDQLGWLDGVDGVVVDAVLSWLDVG